MTATVVLDFIESSRCKYACLESKVKIVACAAYLNGTSAELIIGDQITVEQLLYAMMLPSGNDAAQSLALFFGVLLEY